MSQHLYIALESAPDAPVAWLLWDAKAGNPLDQGELDNARQLSTLAAQSRKTSCYVLVPGTDVTLHQVKLPNNSRRALAAIPYQLEERLCQDPSQLHFAIGKPLSPGNYPVAVVSKSLLSQWQHWLSTAGIKVKALFSESQALPLGTEISTGLQWRDRVIIRSSNQTFFGIDAQSFPQWWSQATQQSHPPLHLHQAAGSVPIGSTEALNTEVMDQPPLHYLAEHLDLNHAINLLRGHQSSEQPEWSLASWRWPLMLALLLAGLYGATLYMENRQLTEQKEQLDAQIEALFRDTFPNTRRIVNIKSQSEQQLRELRRRSAGDPVIRLLDQLLPIFKQVEVRPVGLSYQAERGQFILELEADNATALGLFESQLIPQGFSVTRGKVREQGTGVIGQLSIRREG